MQDLIRKIWKETKKTVFLITHDVDEALTLGTRVIAMSPRPGRIVKEVEIDFTLQMEDSQEDARYTPEYISLRKEILQLMGEGRGGTK
jgi:taurine transport system ATP-binding protein